MIKGIFDGHLTRDAEFKILDKGTNVLSFTVAVDVGYGDNAVTEYVDCTIWGDRGEKVVEYLVKGLQVFVVGNISLRSWNSGSKSGVNFCCNVDDLTFGRLPKGVGSASGAEDGAARQQFPPA